MMVGPDEGADQPTGGEQAREAVVGLKIKAHSVDAEWAFKCNGMCNCCRSDYYKKTCSRRGFGRDKAIRCL